MFTGIIETLGEIKTLEKTDSNLNLTIHSNITNELKIDQRVAHNGICLTGTCTAIKNEQGSWIFTFSYDAALKNVTIEKGSITVNGTSLTVINSKKGEFSVAIIPYTFENTLFHSYKVGTKVNLEFDVIGKYVKRLTEMY